MAVILAARRTAVVPRGGAFATFSPEALAAPVLRACLNDAGLSVDDVDEVILSNAIGPGGNTARRAALLAGLPERVAGLTTDRQCAGGLDALILARAMVDSGMAQVVLAGGAESYSRQPERRMPGAPSPYGQAPFTPWPDRDPNMADAAARLAVKAGLSRADQEDYAAQSHAKALATPDWPEIVAIGDQRRDPFARPLKPALLARAPVVSGSVTAATMAVAADGAAFCLVVADALAQRLGRDGLKIGAGVTLGADPEQPGLAPVPAIRAVLQAEGLTAGDLTRCEVMEAFAAQAMATIAECGLPVARVNQEGGALARGHPIGASGAILAVRVFHGLGQGTGLAAIASAGGLGTAVLFRRAR